MATTFERAAALFDFADQIALVSIKLFQHRLATQEGLTQAEIRELRQLEDRLDGVTGNLRAAALNAVTEAVAQSLAEVRAATVKAQKVITKIAKIEQTIQVVTAVIGLGLAVVAGQPGPIFNAVGSLEEAAGEAKAANAAAKKPGGA